MKLRNGKTYSQETNSQKINPVTPTNNINTIAKEVDLKTAVKLLREYYKNRFP